MGRARKTLHATFPLIRLNGIFQQTLCLLNADFLQATHRRTSSGLFFQTLEGASQSHSRRYSTAYKAWVALLTMSKLTVNICTIGGLPFWWYRASLPPRSSGWLWTGIWMWSRSLWCWKCSQAQGSWESPPWHPEKETESRFGTCPENRTERRLWNRKFFKKIKGKTLLLIRCLMSCWSMWSFSPQYSYLCWFLVEGKRGDLHSCQHCTDDFLCEIGITQHHFTHHQSLLKQYHLSQPSFRRRAQSSYQPDDL